MAKVEFLYNGFKIDVHCNEYDTLENIILKFGSKIKKNIGNLCFLYGGQIINKHLTFIQLANSIDRQRKIISIIVTDNYNNSNTFAVLNENKKLKEKLIEANQKIEAQKKEIQELKYQISMIKSEGMTQVNSLMEIIDKKDKQIKQLRDKPNNKNVNSVNFNDIKTVQFMSMDIIVNFAIACIGTETFSEVEEKLYKKYPEYRETDNRFMSKGIMIKRFKTINENGIKNGDIILLVNPLD